MLFTFLLFKRIVSSIIGILLLTLFVFWGSLPFFIFVSFISALGIYEYNRLTGSKQLLLIFLSLIITSSAYLINTGYLQWSIGFIVITFILLFLFIDHIIKYGYQNIVSSLGVDLLGLIYIGGGMSFFIFLHSFNIRGLWLALIATWVTDTGAFFIGKLLGTRKLTPLISPNKTIEGAVGGVLVTVITIILITLYFDNFSFYWLIYSILVALIAISGDLFESSLKRDMGVKDSGLVIPGHGGILDRFDSLLFTIPFTYFYLTVFLK